MNFSTSGNVVSQFALCWPHLNRKLSSTKTQPSHHSSRDLSDVFSWVLYNPPQSTCHPAFLPFWSKSSISLLAPPYSRSPPLSNSQTLEQNFLPLAEKLSFIPQFPFPILFPFIVLILVRNIPIYIEKMKPKQFQRKKLILPIVLQSHTGFIFLRNAVVWYPLPRMEAGSTSTGSILILSRKKKENV